MCRKPLLRPPGLTLLFMALVTAAFGCSIGMAEASTTTTPPYTVSVSPASVVAGSSGNAVTFRFSATSPADGLLSVAVPPVASGSAWTTPQFTNPAAAGFVKAAKQTCNSAWIASISGDGGGPGTIVVNAKCNKGQQFALTYGAGTGSRVTAATKAGPYTFTAKAVVKGAFVALAAQPVVTVNARRAATLGVTGLANAVAGTPQTPTVTAKDRYGNTAVGYRGTVHFTGSGDRSFFSFYDPGWNVPADYTFTAGDAGTHTFHPIGSGIAAKTAGMQTLTAADSQLDWITVGAQTITISPAATAFQTANFAGISGSAIPGQTVRANIDAVAGDYYGNIATGDNDFINVAVRDGSSEYTLGAFLENGRHIFNISVPVVSSAVQVHANARDRPGVVGLGSAFLLYGPPPKLDEVKLDWDPTTQNPDGTYNGHLDIKNPDTSAVQQVDPNSVVVSGDPIVSFNGTTSIPITIDLLDGGTISTTITVTTPTNATTGEFTTANYSTGTQLQIVGCDSANETFASIDAGTAPTGLPPAPPCPNATWDPVTVNQNTAYVSNPLDNTYLSAIVGTYHRP